MEHAPSRENGERRMRRGTIAHLAGVVDDGKSSRPIPFTVVEIRGNPDGGPDVVKLSRTAHAESIDDEKRWLQKAGYTVDDLSNPDEIYITTAIDEVS